MALRIHELLSVGIFFQIGFFASNMLYLILMKCPAMLFQELDCKYDNWAHNVYPFKMQIYRKRYENIQYFNNIGLQKTPVYLITMKYGNDRWWQITKGIQLLWNSLPAAILIFFLKLRCTI